MDIVVTVIRVEFLEVNPLFESELKLYFSAGDCENYTLIPGSKKELCKLFNLAYNDADQCHFEDIRGKACKVSSNGERYTFVECIDQ